MPTQVDNRARYVQSSVLLPKHCIPAMKPKQIPSSGSSHRWRFPQTEASLRRLARRWTWWRRTWHRHAQLTAAGRGEGGAWRSPWRISSVWHPGARPTSAIWTPAASALHQSTARWLYGFMDYKRERERERERERDGVQPFWILRRASYWVFLLLFSSLCWRELKSSFGTLAGAWKLIMHTAMNYRRHAHGACCMRLYMREISGHTLPRRWSIRSKSREMTTMTEQTEATIHVGVYSSVISGTTLASAPPPPPAMVLKNVKRACWVGLQQSCLLLGLFIMALYMVQHSFSAVVRQR